MEENLFDVIKQSNPEVFTELFDVSIEDAEKFFKYIKENNL